MAEMEHSALARITHWINSLTFFALIISGIAILIAHPRLYWGETGTLGAPALIDLPIPLLLGHTGWGRYLHFLAAWICTLNGLVYAISGSATRLFRKYNSFQRMAYIAVVAVLFPLSIATGLAMSPAITAVFPELVIVFGGHQSARTIHFFVAISLVLFFVVHVVMVSMGGFIDSLRAMTVPRKQTA